MYTAMLGAGRLSLRRAGRLRFLLSSNSLPDAGRASNYCATFIVKDAVASTEKNNVKTQITVPTSYYSTSVNVPVQKKIAQLVKENKIVVFMKGTPEAPRCGFSNAVMQILLMHGVKDFNSHNVLEDDDLRQGIKEYSQWPTIPQVFIDGEFVGGCDIMIEMHQKGDLVEELKKVGIRSALLDKPPSDTSSTSS